MTTKIQKWGNSLAVRLPKNVVNKFKLRQGNAIDVIPSAKNILLKPAKKIETLEMLVDQITPKNVHRKMGWGDPAGREVW